MNRHKRPKEPEVTILMDHESIDAEEYVQDYDRVYRKKEEVGQNKSRKISLFWMRLACFLGLTSLSFVFVYQTIKLLVNLVHSAWYKFNNSFANQETRKAFHDCVALSKVLIGLSVGVINPNWGKWLISLFFSITPKKRNGSLFSQFFNFSHS